MVSFNINALRCTAFAVSALLAACAPWPHVEHVRPRIVGKLVENGRPMPGAEVFLGSTPGTNEPCSEVGERVPVSAADGGFELVARSTTVLTQSLLNPPSLKARITAICIRRPDGTVRIGALLMFSVARAVSVALTCDSAKQVGRDEHGYFAALSPLGQPQFCRAVLVP